MICSTCDTPQAPGATHCSVCGSPVMPSLTLRPLGADLQAAEVAAVSACLAEGMALQNGVFTIEGVLGRGGFGITYRGHDRQLGRTVAIKEFFPSGCVREGTEVRPMADVPLQDYVSARQHFLDEAQVLARFHHPGIVQVFTVFEENNTAYTVMEFLHGRTLAGLLEEATFGLGQERSLALIRKIAPALAAVHDKGLLHRDIKPDNIMIAQDVETGGERVVLIDFGSARELGGGQTRGQSIVLTPGYAPLEQYAGQTRRGAYSDVYALAATLYHMLTGQIPTAAGDRAVGVPLQPVHALNPQIDWAIADAVHRAMETEIARRPQSVREFMAALFAGDAPGDLRPLSGEFSDYAHRDTLTLAAHESPAASATMMLNSPSKNVTKPIGSILRSVALSQPVEPEKPEPGVRLPVRLRSKPPAEEGGVQVRKRGGSFFPKSSFEWGLVSLSSFILVTCSLMVIYRVSLLELINLIFSRIR